MARQFARRRRRLDLRRGLAWSRVEIRFDAGMEDDGLRPAGQNSELSTCIKYVCSCVVEESWGQKQEGKEDVICAMCIEALQYLLEHD